ncbi:MAG: redoxin domain-containing protein [Burkholderiales bacterium]|nr:redoxin domain-containing protein [Burkholderiales bacterium]
MWQSLFDELKDHGFIVLAVALDRPEAARPWIEAAKATYPCLIDRDHHLADLYNLVNVPQALWLDEAGRIVRPPETAGATDGFRAMDRKTFTMPEGALAERTRVRALYFDALRDWARRGPASAHALDAGRAAAKLRLPQDAVAEAHARFRLGQQLLRSGQAGDAEEAREWMAEATRRHPDSWAMWRQAAAKDARGLASGPEFWARVDALGSRPYYAPAEISEAPRPPAS